MDLPGDRAAGEWECMECGYIEAGAKSRRLEACPECGAPAEALEFFPFGDEDEAWEDVASEDLYDVEEEIEVDEGEMRRR